MQRDVIAKPSPDPIFGRLLVLLTVFIVVASCGPASNHISLGREQFELVPTGQLALPLDSVTSQNDAVEHFTDPKTGQGYFVCNSSQAHRLLFYDDQRETLAFGAQFAEDGPDAVGQMCDFYVHSLDSIFLTRPPVQFVLADTTGKVKKRYDLRSGGGGTNQSVMAFCTVTGQNTQPVRGKHFYFFRWPDGLNQNWSVLKRPFLGQLDLFSGQVTILPAHYPDSYLGHHWSVIHKQAGIVLAPLGFLLNFPGSDSIYAWRNGQATAHYAGSQFVTDPLEPVDREPTTELEMDRPIIEQQCYAGLGYDPWRQVYYRIAWHPHDDLSNVGNILRIYAEKPCSIIILDKNLNIIGETMLPRDRYFTMCWFIGPKGLYISDAHPDNPDLDEDVLSYTLFTLAKRKDE
jgi:hypothetical protein